MSLSTEVQARVATQLLVELTNPNDNTASSIDTTLLGKAVDDVEGDFLSYGITIDVTNKAHVVVAVDGALYRLMAYKGGPEVGAMRSRYHEALERL